MSRVPTTSPAGASATGAGTLAAPPARADAVLRCEGISHGFGKKHVLHDVSLEVVRGQIVALVGPSGSGKSTLLRAILGTHPARAGRVLLDGRPVTGPSRHVGVVYQRYTLYPFLTALDNVALGPILDTTSLLTRVQPWKFLPIRRAARERAAELLTRVGLEHAMHQYPTQMSGGMCQRVAIAQALILRPALLLLDEPFGALDEAMREELQTLLLELYQENLAAKRAGSVPPHTILIVTHELNEALFVADRVLGLSQYWRYEDEGHERCPGATIVYDACAPVFSPGDRVPFDRLYDQRQEIRRAVMDEQPRRPRRQFVRYWDEVARGEARGIVAT